MKTVFLLSLPSEISKISKTKHLGTELAAVTYPSLNLKLKGTWDVALTFPSPWRVAYMRRIVQNGPESCFLICFQKSYTR